MRWVRIATIFVVEIACFLCDAVYNLNTIPLGKFLLSSFERLYADDGGMCILTDPPAFPFLAPSARRRC